WGTAVNVQAMVFGNMGSDCATGVAFTRNPATGENAFYGEYLVNAQGEDVVAGIRTPQHLTIAAKKEIKSSLPAMEEVMPAVFAADEAEDRAAKGEKVILVRVETSPEDIHGMHAAVGILTARGGMTSHAAVVARGMGRPCISGAGDLRIDAQARTMTVRGVKVADGDLITLDGGTGEVMLGEVPTIQPELSGNFATLMGWADQARRLKVRTNAETPKDARTARGFGAEGIGLCRTEHMFFDGGRIVAMREMIMAETSDGRRAALAKILPMQRDDFVELFQIMKGLPVTIRLLDPPLHEVLPNTDGEMDEVAKASGVAIDTVKHRAAMLKESNPM